MRVSVMHMLCLDSILTIRDGEQYRLGLDSRE